MTISQYGRPMGSIYRKQTWLLYVIYGQLNKNETIVSVIKRLFGEYIISSW
jgi:hypothetical protein